MSFAMSESESPWCVRGHGQVRGKRTLPIANLSRRHSSSVLMSPTRRIEQRARVGKKKKKKLTHMARSKNNRTPPIRKKPPTTPEQFSSLCPCSCAKTPGAKRTYRLSRRRRRSLVDARCQLFGRRMSLLMVTAHGPEPSPGEPSR